MSGFAYYNEIDEYAAQWLRNLIQAGHIAPGVVDTRSIEDVRPQDLRGFKQCHFFAGIGVWSYALRRAGWPDDRPVWTGSCPCQPFSAAGKGSGFADERHLWPHFHWLIQERKPATVLGEQVASADGLQWLDLVQTDLEATGYAVGAADLCAAGVGAPHIRQRLYWVAHRSSTGLEKRVGIGRVQRREVGAHTRQTSIRRGNTGGLADTNSIPGGQGCEIDRGRNQGGHARPRAGSGGSQLPDNPGPVNGLWRDADWLFCRDGKWRPVEASAQPLVDGSAESLGRVRPEIIAQVEEEINAATAQAEGGRTAAMRALLETLGAEAKCCWPAGGVPRLHEAPFLLAFLRQLQAQGWNLAEGVALSRSEATSGVLRSVWHDQAVAGASHRRGLEEQRSGEPADVVRVLSRILARHASEAWGNAYAGYAEIGFPIGHNAPARVGRLRAYGNAINAEQAVEFIKAVGVPA